MTDRTNDIDQAERIRRLQERRAASSGSRRPATPRTVSSATAPMADAPAARPPSTRSPAAGRKRRRHPAAASRWLLAGLSLASFFTIAGTVAVANVNSVATPPASTPTAVVATPALPATQAATPATAAPAPAAQQPTRAAPVPHTTTRGS
jgi:hypothetical protein